MAFLLFGDQSLDTYGFLAYFHREGNPSVLSREFLRLAGEALKCEVDKLPRSQRQMIPIFRTLQELNEKYHAQGLKYPAIDSALLCVAQLAHYIEYAYILQYALPSQDTTNSESAGQKRNMAIARRRKTRSFRVCAPDSLRQRRSHLVHPSQPYSPSPSKLS